MKGKKKTVRATKSSGAPRKKQPDDAEDAMRLAVENVRDLRRSIQKATGRVEEAWFGNLLLGILNCVLTDYQAVRAGCEKSVYLAAWACRNLLELRVITTYILKSRSNSLDFRNELVIDAKEFYEALSKHHESSHRELLVSLSEMSEQEEGPVKELLQLARRKEYSQGADTASTDSEAAAYKSLMINFGLPDKAKPKRSSEIAQLVNQNEQFNPMFKVCSKIMHRTALSIASTVTQASLDEVTPLLLHHGANDLLKVYGLIEAHFRAHGIQPPAS